jgi:succinate dehydrogenase / fumarate reductase cytochrome b subunit
MPFRFMLGRTRDGMPRDGNPGADRFTTGSRASGQSCGRFWERLAMAELEVRTATGTERARPLSPHLQIYKPMLTMMMSIVHRVTGAALYFGMLLLAWWLIAAASGPNAYAAFEWFMGSIIGQLVLFAYTWALLHHMLGGVRHLIWDTIHGFEPAEREMLTLATLIGSITLTLILWVVGYLVMGGPR